MAIFGLGIHFLLISVYSKPFERENKSRLDYYSQAYAQPYFHQTWNLFVPAPTSNYTLLVKYTDKNGNPQNMDIFGEILHKHQGNRFRGYGPILLGLVNSIHFVEKNELSQQVYTSELKNNDINFCVLKQTALQTLRFGSGQDIADLKLLLLVSDSFSNKIRAYYSPGYFGT